MIVIITNTFTLIPFKMGYLLPQLFGVNSYFPVLYYFFP